MFLKTGQGGCAALMGGLHSAHRGLPSTCFSLETSITSMLPNEHIFTIGKL